MGALHDQGVIVTGAGRGIGRALATRAAREGARVVVNDLNADNAAAVAAEIGGTAIAGDVTAPEVLIDAATEALGRVDVFFANAGIDGAGGHDSLQTPDDVWDRVVNVNVMAHVRAARALVPRWLEDGRGGRFVVTASAAGLLTMIGSAPYSVTKHAAVGFAEWLSVTYGARGIDVHAICPQGVKTQMLEDAGPLQALLSRDSALEPEQVADAAFAAIEEGRFLVLPHAEVAGYYAARATDTERWLAGMRRLQQKVDEAGALG
ncbi:SDR family NAD(P)-dependent oxidoreductase [Nocardioides sp. MAH-18]|uniref:SDR family NAD(P)-dependent oxidoreductase n=1 Tax=Nocardioides agri TaxID=2682843 RepID=A0A6L6XQ69_9ACTN|nr:MULTISPECIES: SDR family oxidoreductase [unclassified Nocardioides]MBA2954297.1 SDR family oxidoreductase [Nocardioides sp. CGMCC 1.13656]MVQ49158.1 SDR family NAD(P)-dependent oxidoreductase [Nocardioides sp. MAH-18]